MRNLCIKMRILQVEQHMNDVQCKYAGDARHCMNSSSISNRSCSGVGSLTAPFVVAIGRNSGRKILCAAVERAKTREMSTMATNSCRPVRQRSFHRKRAERYISCFEKCVSWTLSKSADFFDEFNSEDIERNSYTKLQIARDKS